MRRIPILLVTLLLANCGSSPKTHYFTLAAVPGSGLQTPALEVPVTVAAVRVPPTLDRQEMVRRTGPTTVEVSDQDRWTAPLADMSRRVLAEDLAARLPSADVILPDAPSPPRMAQIVVTIDEFGPVAQNGATLKGSWTLLESGRSSPLLRRDVSLAIKSSDHDGSGAAAAMSILLGQLATRITDTLAKALVASQALRCQMH